MKNTTRYIAAIILSSGSLTSIWFLLNNLEPLKPALYSFSFTCLVGVGIFLKLFAPNVVEKLRSGLIGAARRKHFIVTAIFIVTLFGILARLYFYFRFSYAPVSDPSTFYGAAQKIAHGRGMTGDTYVAFFPYLAAYETVLGLAAKVIASPWLATIVLNTVFDLAAAGFAYFMIKKMVGPASGLPLLAFAIWFLSPFNILFSVISLPIIMVNFFIVAMLFLTYLLCEKVAVLKTRASLMLASVLGAVIGYGNCFRPIFSIAIVALFLLFLYIALAYNRTRRSLMLLGSVFLLVMAVFLGVQKLNLSYVTKATGVEVPSNDSGWSIYVGSDSETDGTWSQADQDRVSVICKNSPSNETCQERLQNAGIARYKSHGIGGTLSLFIRKLYVFSGNQNFVYNAQQSITSYTGSKTAKLMNIYILMFVAVLFAMSARFLYRSAKSALSGRVTEPTIVFTSILMLGFFLSDMFVETSPRYAQIMYPVFIIFAVISLDPGKQQSRT